MRLCTVGCCFEAAQRGQKAVRTDSGKVVECGSPKGGNSNGPANASGQYQRPSSHAARQCHETVLKVVRHSMAHVMWVGLVACWRMPFRSGSKRIKGATRQLPRSRFVQPEQPGGQDQWVGSTIGGCFNVGIGGQRLSNCMRAGSLCRAPRCKLGCRACSFGSSSCIT